MDITKKNWLLVITIAAFILGCNWGTSLAAEASLGPIIKVGLWTGQANVVVASDGPLIVVDAATGKQIKTIDAGQRVAIGHQSQRLVIGGQPTVSAAIKLIPKSDNAASCYIEVNKHRYRGQIDIWYSPSLAGLTVVNRLPVEHYLYGVIAGEISPNWPVEAVKAQAVAARTYAFYSMGRHKDEGFDVCTTTHCQVYLGRERESERVLSAVDATRGVVVTYQKQLIPTYFFSSSGGYTENSENVWGKYVPYLRATPDFDQDSPDYRWTKTFTADEINRLIAQAGYKIGKLQAIGLSPLTPPPVKAVDRGVSGRVKSIQLFGDKGSVTVSGIQLRNILGLKSTLFDIDVVVPVQKKVDFRITDSYGDHARKTIEIELPSRADTRRTIEKPDIRRLSGLPDEEIVFIGSGSGHGVGLSQWGAKAMAEKAPAGDTTYFRKILQHYYRGSEVINLY